MTEAPFPRDDDLEAAAAVPWPRYLSWGLYQGPLKEFLRGIRVPQMVL